MESVSGYRGNPFAMLPEGRRCLGGLDDVLDLLHARKTVIYFSVACWIHYSIFPFKIRGCSPLNQMAEGRMCSGGMDVNPAT